MRLHPPVSPYQLHPLALMSPPQSSPAAARNILEAQAKRVQRICPDKALGDIRMDLQFTKDIEQTINRAFDGEVRSLRSSPFLALLVMLSVSFCMGPLETPAGHKVSIGCVPVMKLRS